MASKSNRLGSPCRQVRLNMFARDKEENEAKSDDLEEDKIIMGTN